MSLAERILVAGRTCTPRALAAAALAAFGLFALPPAGALAQQGQGGQGQGVQAPTRSAPQGPERPSRELARIYVSPAGAGNEGGDRPGNAMPIGQALSLIEAGGRPMHVRLLAGEYRIGSKRTLRLWRRRNSDWPLTIEGEGPSTQLVGDYEPGGPRTPALFTLNKNGVTLLNFSARNFGTFLDVPSDATALSLRIKDVLVENVIDGIVVDRRKNVTVQDWQLEGLTIRRYVRVGIRLSGPRTERIRIARSRIDGGGADAPSDCFKAGIQLYESVRDVTIEDVTVSGNVGCVQDYRQGDGIEADDKLGTPDLITLRRVTSIGNRDGNFDLKATNTVLEDLVSRTDGVTRHGFRFWSHPYTCVRCTSEGGSTGSGGRGSESDVSLRNARVEFVDPVTPASAWKWSCSENRSRREEGISFRVRGERALASACE